MDNNIKKSISLIILSIGMAIFAMVILWHVEALASKSQAELKLFSASLDWEDYLYHQTVEKVKNERKAPQR
ncbi:MAG: hypothetical protein WC552_09855 [Candidatus Omnitrophota bacterium]